MRIDRAKRAPSSASRCSTSARTLQLAFGGQRFGYFLKDGKQYQVIGQLERGDRNEPGRPEAASSCAPAAARWSRSTTW